MGKAQSALDGRKRRAHRNRRSQKRLQAQQAGGGGSGVTTTNSGSILNRVGGAGRASDAGLRDSQTRPTRSATTTAGGSSDFIRTPKSNANNPMAVSWAANGSVAPTGGAASSSHDSQTFRSDPDFWRSNSASSRRNSDVATMVGDASLAAALAVSNPMSDIDRVMNGMTVSSLSISQSKEVLGFDADADDDGGGGHDDAELLAAVAAYAEPGGASGSGGDVGGEADIYVDGIRSYTKEMLLYKSSKLYSRNHDDFAVVERLGRSAGCKMFKVREKTSGQVYAMRVYSKAEIVKKSRVIETLSEREMLEKLQHPFIIELFCAYHTDKRLYIVYEFLGGGDLYDLIQRYEPPEGDGDVDAAAELSGAMGGMPVDDVRTIAAQCVLALLHMHAANILYRNLSAENVLFDSRGFVRLANFGLSEQLDGAPDAVSRHRFLGTPEYLAPEMINGLPYGLHVDWWSLGVLIYEMLTGLPPFYDDRPAVMYQRVLSETVQFSASSDRFPPAARDLVSKLLLRDVAQRMAAVADIKQHPFFGGVDWLQLMSKTSAGQPLTAVAHAASTQEAAVTVLKSGSTAASAETLMREVHGATNEALPPMAVFDGFEYDGPL